MNSTQYKTYQFNDYSLAIESGIDTSLIADTLATKTLTQETYLETDSGTDGVTDRDNFTETNLTSFDLIISQSCDSDKRNQGLNLLWQSADKGELNFTIDVQSLVQRYHSFPIPKQGAFNQALGKKSKTIVDASGGWGADALLMAMQGYRVTTIEREPIMALLLQDAFDRFAQLEWVQNNRVPDLTVLHANAHKQLSDKTLSADCVYFDPMFPPKRKKSAGVNKRMQLLQWLVGQDSDAAEVLKTIMHMGAPRVAVKRPTHVLPLLENPSAHFSSKLVHYDVYLNQ